MSRLVKKRDYKKGKIPLQFANLFYYLIDNGYLMHDCCIECIEFSFRERKTSRGKNKYDLKLKCDCCGNVSVLSVNNFVIGKDKDDYP